MIRQMKSEDLDRCGAITGFTRRQLMNIIPSSDNIEEYLKADDVIDYNNDIIMWLENHHEEFIKKLEKRI